MRAGKLRHKIDLVALGGTKLPNGEWSYTHTYEPGQTGIWAEVRPASAREVARGQELGRVVTHTVVMRYREGVAPSMQVIFNPEAVEPRTFEIAGIINVEERNIELRLLCVETR